MQKGLLVPLPPPTPEQHPSSLAMGSVHRGKDHVEPRLGYSRFLMSKKISLQWKPAGQGAPEAAKDLWALAVKIFLHDVHWTLP